MSSNSDELKELLIEIRDLLLPVSDAYRDAFEERQAQRAAARQQEVVASLSTDKRRRAWELADGTRTQREIAREVGLDEGAASKFFKTLRELGALSPSANPERILEV